MMYTQVFIWLSWLLMINILLQCITDVISVWSFRPIGCRFPEAAVQVQSLLVGVDLTSMTLGELRSRWREFHGFPWNFWCDCIAGMLVSCTYLYNPLYIFESFLYIFLYCNLYSICSKMLWFSNLFPGMVIPDSQAWRKAGPCRWHFSFQDRHGMPWPASIVVHGMGDERQNHAQ